MTNGVCLDIGKSLLALAREQADWSQATFGSDEQRGPIGALKHLAKEAIEAAENPADREEYADCFLLILDASRRAGINPSELIRVARMKLEVCKMRDWPVPVSDEAVEHVRS